MNEKYSEKLMEKLAGELTEKEASLFEQDLKKNKNAWEEYQFFTQVWEDMDCFDTPIPSNSLADTFYTKLDQETQRQEHSLRAKWFSFRQYILNSSHLFRNVSFGLLVLAIGFILGGKWNSKTIHVNQNTTIQTPTPSQTQVETASYIPATMKIEYINQIPLTAESDEQAIFELKDAIENETNTNVKLAALFQMNQHYASNKTLRNFLVAQLQREQSPLVQVELLNLMMENSKAKESVTTMEDILNNKQLNPIVQEKIKNDLPLLRASYIR